MSMVVPERTERKYEPYPEYEDSGVEWLGQIPSHWDIRKLKQISSTKVSGVDKHSKEDEKPVYLCNYTDVYNKDTILPDNGFMEATATDNEIALFSLKKDDVIITKDSEDWRDIAVPSYVSTNLPGVICGYHLALIRPELSNIIGRFLFWSFYARNINHQFVIASTGITRFGLGKYWLDNSLFLIPPIEEQRTIADFLDRETARIDELIAKKQRLIDLLKEQRTALITRTVTKGLNQNVHMKDSGVEWLGEIPSHWGVKKLKYVADVEMGQSPSSEDYSYDNQGIPFLQGNADFTELYPQAIVWCDTANKTAAIGDILLSVRAPIGAVNIADQVYGIGRGLCAIQGSNMCQKYLYYTTLCLNKELNSLGTGSTYTAVSVDQVENVVILMPSNKEQQAIADYLDRETTRIDTLVIRINQAIEKLQEYRSALITAAVTGKIDVRQQVS